MVFSNMLWVFNLNTGFSGLQCLEDIYYMYYSTFLTV